MGMGNPLVVCVFTLLQFVGETMGEKEVLHRVFLSREAYPNAVCNDGSQAAYYFKAAISGAGRAQEDVWLVYLQGGGWCYSEESCEQREKTLPTFMSSAQWEDSVHIGGIFSPDSAASPLAKANKVYMRYCSSDAFVGDAAADTPAHAADTPGSAADTALNTTDTASNGARRWHFRGQAILAGVLREMTRVHGLSNGHTLLLAGCSSGGRGVLFSLEALERERAREGGAIPHRLRLLPLIDAAIWLSGVPSLVQQTQSALRMLNASARLGSACLAAFPHPADRWKCLFSQFRATLSTATLLVSNSQYDTVQLTSLLGHAPPYSPPETATVEEHRAAMAALLRSLPPSAAVFSAACYQHCRLERSRHVLGYVQGREGEQVSLYDMIARLLESEEPHAEREEPRVQSEEPHDEREEPTLQVGTPTPRQKVLESCAGLDCGCQDRDPSSEQATSLELLGLLRLLLPLAGCVLVLAGVQLCARRGSPLAGAPALTSLSLRRGELRVAESHKAV